MEPPHSASPSASSQGAPLRTVTVLSLVIVNNPAVDENQGHKREHQNSFLTCRLDIERMKKIQINFLEKTWWFLLG